MRVKHVKMVICTCIASCFYRHCATDFTWRSIYQPSVTKRIYIHFVYIFIVKIFNLLKLVSLKCIFCTGAIVRENINLQAILKVFLLLVSMNIYSWPVISIFLAESSNRRNWLWIFVVCHHRIVPPFFAKLNTMFWISDWSLSENQNQNKSINKENKIFHFVNIYGLFKHLIFKRR